MTLKCLVSFGKKKRSVAQSHLSEKAEDDISAKSVKAKVGKCMPKSSSRTASLLSVSLYSINKKIPG